MTNSIEISNLSYQYGKQWVLDDINLSVPTGSIYGFLGPNGAGKTTTLRLILGLLQLKSGSIKVLDHHLATHRLEILKKVGSLVEYPSIYGHLTANENLLVWQKIFGCPKSKNYGSFGNC